jgi:hypothetical protein
MRQLHAGGYPQLGSSGSSDLPELGAGTASSAARATTGAWARTSSTSSSDFPGLASRPPAAREPAKGVTRASFARAGCRPHPPPAPSSIVDSVADDHTIDNEGFNRAVYVSGSEANTPLPPGLATRQQSSQFQESEGGWRSRRGQQRIGAAAGTVARNMDGRELTREPQVLACAPAVEHHSCISL